MRFYACKFLIGIVDMSLVKKNNNKRGNVQEVHIFHWF